VPLDDAAAQRLGLGDASDRRGCTSARWTPGPLSADAR
jgi:hypothetical protein